MDVSYRSIKVGVNEGKKLAHRSLAGSVNIRGPEYIACPSEGGRYCLTSTGINRLHIPHNKAKLCVAELRELRE